MKATEIVAFVIANELGTNLYDISKALGHSQVGTKSGIYTHILMICISGQ